MYISNEDAKSFLQWIEEKLADIKPNNIKNLDQEERKHILTIVKIYNHPHTKYEELIEGQSSRMTDKSEAQNLIDNIKEKISQSTKSKPSNFITSFFKGLANFFHFRVSSGRVFTAISTTHLKMTSDDF